MINDFEDISFTSENIIETGFLLVMAEIAIFFLSFSIFLSVINYHRKDAFSELFDLIALFATLVVLIISVSRAFKEASVIIEDSRYGSDNANAVITFTFILMALALMNLFGQHYIYSKNKMRK